MEIGSNGSGENDRRNGSYKACFGEILRLIAIISVLSVLSVIGLIRCSLRLVKKIGDVSVIKIIGVIGECLRLVHCCHTGTRHHTAHIFYARLCLHEAL